MSHNTVETRTSGLAITGFVLALVGIILTLVLPEFDDPWVFGLVFGILAIWFGQVRKGYTLAKASWILGIISVLLGVIAIIVS